MKKRVVALLLTGCMILGTLVGCGQTQQETKSSDETKTSQTSQSAEKSSEASGEKQEAVDYDPFGKYEDEITIEIALDSSNMKFDSTEDGYGSMEDNVWTRAYKEELGINLEYIWTAPTDEYDTKWNVSITADDIPDVAIVSANVYSQLLEGGYVEDMTEYYEQYASDAYKAAVDADGGVAQSFITVDGRMMGLPHPGTTPDNVSLLYIRKDWLEELNLEVPTTVDQLIETAKAFQKAKLGGDNTVGIAFHGDMDVVNMGELSGFLDGFGAHLNIWVEGDDGNLIFGDVQPKVKEALQALQNMYAEGLIASDFATAGFDGVKALVTSGQCGIVYGTNWISSHLYNTETMEMGDWMVVNGVTSDGSDYVAHGDATPSKYLFVKKGIENPEAVVKMINLQFKLLAEANDVYNTYVKKDGSTISALYYCIAPFMRAPWQNETKAKTIREALETGDESKVIGTAYEKSYVQVKAVEKEGSTDMSYAGNYGNYGTNGAFGLINTMWEEGRIYVNKFASSYSDFALQNMKNMQEILYAEYIKIIMGADINNFDKAVETWMQTGGERITQEVNEWYQTTK